MKKASKASSKKETTKRKSASQTNAKKKSNKKISKKDLMGLKGGLGAPARCCEYL